VNRVSPGGRVVGIDVIPAQPPRGASSIQGDFLSEEVRRGVREYVSDEGRGRVKVRGVMDQEEGEKENWKEEEEGVRLSRKEKDSRGGRVVDVVLSDMSAPWDLVSASWIKSVSNPWSRMMNTSGMPFRDHAGSMVCRPTTLSRSRIIELKTPDYTKLTASTGSVSRGADVLLRYSSHRGQFSLQVLSRRRGQGF